MAVILAELRNRKTGISDIHTYCPVARQWRCHTFSNVHTTRIKKFDSMKSWREFYGEVLPWTEEEFILLELKCSGMLPDTKKPNIGKHLTKIISVVSYETNLESNSAL